MNDAAEAPRGRVALIGAYERDNFGDLLFLHQTQAYLEAVGLEVVATSAFEADMRPLLGRQIPAFHRVLAEESFDHVWTVGGEVGGATMDTAYRSLADDRFSHIGARSGGRAARIRALSGAEPGDPAYVARLTAFPTNALASLTVNSVGVSGLAALSAEERRVHLAALRECDSLVVRDRRSDALLAEANVPHTLAPDLIHSIALTRARPRVSDVVLVQAAERWIKAVGPQQVARALVGVPQLRDARVRLLLAGTAPGHDSPAAYRTVIDEVRALSPEVDIAVWDGSRDPWEIVDAIGGARLWVGQSLHGRIVAGAFGVPRLSLADPKLDMYAATWDRDMPAGVTPATLGVAVDEALSARSARQDQGLGRRLGLLADASVRATVDRMLARDPLDRAVARFASVESLRRGQVSDAEGRVLRRAEDSVSRGARSATAVLDRHARALVLRARSSTGRSRG
ncbi:polysaccharide pyruvyl transferase family protein [Actinotalea ferrariae]|uniref:polysaccharide pyruvyl transferase family protein n=1 Tax=Actinotalea ferrariae TaxID=1386098 RepID=UPI001C8C3CF9|nr:polysaccharide pyruvyl transferase family protein [Actinotalea ferrariae]MBX9244242.1 polysaccharide pyruvyl transferase family protein [Actinotalea ferrariae]